MKRKIFSGYLTRGPDRNRTMAKWETNNLWVFNVFYGNFLPLYSLNTDSRKRREKRRSQSHSGGTGLHGQKSHVGVKIYLASEAILDGGVTRSDFTILGVEILCTDVYLGSLFLASTTQPFRANMKERIC